ncbi:Acetyltransferase (GNAT) family protein [Chishuiella changwenlii]|uniref:Acetyltransferase (GNAT) family protein n=1 Tax=Chishuiella changwenlii TaxID=1434701 RepID=A0A1M6YDY8_9FLAO|nr:Acetyltransferase (GNAT) family protein [Chishuiella changwenlii]
MFLIIIFSVQFYLLAKFFKKDKLKTILSAVGLYIAGEIAFSFVFVLLFATGVIDIGININNMSVNNLTENSLKMNKYLMDNYVTIAVQLFLYVAIGMIYYNSLKRKWTFEMIEGEMNKRKEEVLENIEIKKKISPIKLNVYVHFHAVNEKNIHLIESLSKDIWNDAYKDLLSQEQIDYMLDMMYNVDKVNEGLANGEIWEIVKVDNVPVGYLHYKLDENNTVFLSKIYLKTTDKTKGVGQVMMNHVIEYANSINAKDVHLTVNKENARAIRFYEKNGFKNIESKTFDIGNGYVMDDYIYQKNLITKLPQL